VVNYQLKGPIVSLLPLSGRVFFEYPGPLTEARLSQVPDSNKYTCPLKLPLLSVSLSGLQSTQASVKSLLTDFVNLSGRICLALRASLPGDVTLLSIGCQDKYPDCPFPSKQQWSLLYRAADLFISGHPTSFFPDPFNY